jgi:hypothetical protein
MWWSVRKYLLSFLLSSHPVLTSCGEMSYFVVKYSVPNFCTPFNYMNLGFSAWFLNKKWNTIIFHWFGWVIAKIHEKVTKGMFTWYFQIQEQHYGPPNCLKNWKIYRNRALKTSRSTTSKWFYALFVPCLEICPSDAISLSRESVLHSSKTKQN